MKEDSLSVSDKRRRRYCSLMSRQDMKRDHTEKQIGRNSALNSKTLWYLERKLKVYTKLKANIHSSNSPRNPSSNLVDVAVINSRGSVSSSADNLVHVVAIVVSSVDSVFLSPFLSVESAVGTEGNAVLGQDIGGEEVAGLVVAVFVDNVLAVELSLGVASSGAEAGVVGVGVEEAHAVVGVVVFAILLDQGRVDRSVEVLGCFETGNKAGRLALGFVELGVSLTDISECCVRYR